MNDEMQTSDPVEEKVEADPAGAPEGSPVQKADGLAADAVPALTIFLSPTQGISVATRLPLLQVMQILAGAQSDVVATLEAKMRQQRPSPLVAPVPATPNPAFAAQIRDKIRRGG